MNRKVRFYLTPILLPLSVTLILAGCGGGGGSSSSSSVTGLTVAENVSVVEAQDAVAKPTAVGGTTKPLEVDFASMAGTYATDDTDLWVYDPSVEAMNTVNMILCLMGQTQYAAKVNDGNYIALIDGDGCETGSNGSSTGSTGESSTGGTQLETWVINSSRASSTSDHIVMLWADEPAEDDMPATRIYIYAVITEGASTSNPYGEFTMQFFGRELDTSTGLVVPGTAGERFKGVLAAGPGDVSGQVRFDFDMTEGDIAVAASSLAVGEWAFAQAATIIADVDAATGDTSSGTAYTRNAFKANFGFGTEDEDDVFDLAYNAANMLKFDGATNTCLDRTSFDTTIWRYGLYNVSDGARVDVNSGWPIKTASGEYGWMGYWGLWVPESAPAADSIDGATITKIDYSGVGADVPYTLKVAPGKLIKYTKNTLTLAELVGVPLDYWDSGVSKNYRVEYNGVDFKYLASFDPSTGQWDTGDAKAGTTFTLSTDWNDFWSDALGGNVMIDTSDGTVAGITGITYYKESVVSASETADLTLNCYVECLEAPIDSTSANWSGADIPYQVEAGSPASPYTYIYDVSAMTLFSGSIGAGNEVQLGSGVTVTSGTPNEWGFRSGPMVLSTTDTSSWGSVWDVWNETTYYVWETGPNSWNSFSGVQDATQLLADTYETFDPPLQFLYEHTTLNDYNGDSTNNGQYLLEYYGFGDLGGIPWVGDADDRWNPQFSIKSSTVVGDGDEYKLKALEGEQQMQDAASLSVCTGAGLAIDRPTAATLTWSDPSVTIGTIPTVTDPPAVVDGEIQ